MDYLRLTIGLLLPWMGGFFWLRASEFRFGCLSTPHIFRQLGFGYFIGLAGLYFLIQTSSKLTGQVSFWPLISILAVLTCAGAMLPGARNKTGSVASFPSRPVVVIVLMVLIAAHLGAGATEAINLPTYPWDAWLAWAYRAKAWYYSGYLAPLSPPAEWLSRSELYTMAAAGYPEFASVVPFWAAVSLGKWSETLINAPVILCGLALALGVYGSCREYNSGPISALLATYLFLSLPIIGTHLSLAGYADIWMVGFAGLGMLALIQGLIAGQKFRITLALGFLAFSTLVKNEGVVWLYIGLALSLLASVRPTYLLWAGLGTVTCAALVWISGMVAVQLPGLGTVGIQEGQLHLPFVDPQTIHQFSLSIPYRVALFQHSSWNILAVLLLLATLATLSKSRGKERLIVIAFMILFMTSQYVIFGLTEQGYWATSYTAISRFPMHMAPVMVFLALLGLNQIKPRGQSAGAPLWVVYIAPVMTFLLVSGYIVIEMKPSTPGKTVPPVVASGANMHAVMGQSRLQGEAQEVTGFENGMAIISAGRSNLPSDRYQHLDINLLTNGHKAPSFFWRTADRPTELQTLDIGENMSALDLSAHSQWKGRVIEFGVAFYELGTSTASLRQIALSPATLGSNAKGLLESWRSTLPWTQQSINRVISGQKDQRLHPVSLLSTWLALTLLLSLTIAAIRPSRSTIFPLIPTCAISAWLVLDIQWMNVRVDRLTDTMNTAREPGPTHIMDGGDMYIAELAQAIKSVGLGTDSRIAIVSHDGPNAFESLRMKYHLLPLSAHPVINQQLQSLDTLPDGILLLAKPRNPDPQWLATSAEQLSKDLGLNADFQASSNYGILLVPDLDKGL